MNKEEIEAIKELIDSSNLSLIGDGTMIVKNTTIATILNLIDKLQKENKKYIDIFNSTEKIMNGQERTKDKLLKENVELQKQLDKLKEVDRQICCEELITKDKYQDILKENEELSKSNFHFLEINQKLIEEKPIIKELAEKELNLLEKIDKLQRDSISKDIIRNKIKELEKEMEKTSEVNWKEEQIDILEELLGE